MSKNLDLGKKEKKLQLTVTEEELKQVNGGSVRYNFKTSGRER